MADETSVMDLAVSDTAGEILEQPGVPPAPATPAAQGSLEVRTVLPGQPGEDAGVPVLAQYSASTGGRTVGGPFPGVVDRGDSVCIKSPYYTCNPCHRWSAAVPVSALEKKFKSLGALAAVQVTQRNGVGALGGRVEAVAIVGVSGAEMTVAPYELGALVAGHNHYHCASDWYAVTNGP